MLDTRPIPSFSLRGSDWLHFPQPCYVTDTFSEAVRHAETSKQIKCLHRIKTQKAVPKIREHEYNMYV